ncbi:MAG TPA: VOC family protein [Jatrophihabitantaceae bacterium]|nr:VOC family protein [Jatrophihabitantaceae bacterium]
MPARFDHVTISASDFAASLRFYDAALAPLGLARLHELGDEEEDEAAVEAAAFGPVDGRPVVWLVSGPAPTRAAHLALRADRRDDVERFHAAALGSGGSSRSAPRRWPIYRRGDFNALVADPDGNLIEAVSGE